jgi:putative ABC transport system substrate-binding protein
LAEELVRLKVDLIVAWFTPAALAARQATHQIPIVLALVGNPVETGLVASLAQPGGNVTGMAAIGAELAGKLVDVVHELMPAARRIAALTNVPDPFSKPFLHQIDSSAAAAGITIGPIMIHSSAELDAAFSALEKERSDALIVQPSLPIRRVAELALRYRVPAVSFIRDFADQGGLLSYGTDEADAYRKAAVYVDKILKGAKPADLPVQQPTKFELVINLKTAKALGLTVPQSFLVRADEVIE